MRWLLWCGIPPMLGVLGYVAVNSWVGPREPRIEYPNEVDLGERALGEQAVGRFSITNLGGSELVIDSIRTNCSCTGMELERDGRFTQVAKLRLQPRERADLAVRIAVRGEEVGASMNNTILFRTNDPAHPEGQLNVVVRRVTGIVTCRPKSLIFGTVPVGTKVRQVICLEDSMVPPRAIDRVTSVGSRCVSARLLPTEELGEPGEQYAGGKLIGRVEIIVDTSSAADVDSRVEVQLNGETRTARVLSVAGRVAAPIEIRPSVLFLPRTSSEGPLFEARAVFSSSTGKPLSLTFHSGPQGLTADISQHGPGPNRLVCVTWDPRELSAGPEGQRYVLRFRAKAGELDCLMDLPVVLQP